MQALRRPRSSRGSSRSTRPTVPARRCDGLGVSAQAQRPRRARGPRPARCSIREGALAVTRASGRGAALPARRLRLPREGGASPRLRPRHALERALAPWAQSARPARDGRSSATSRRGLLERQTRYQGSVRAGTGATRASCRPSSAPGAGPPAQDGREVPRGCAPCPECEAAACSTSYAQRGAASATLSIGEISLHAGRSELSSRASGLKLSDTREARIAARAPARDPTAGSGSWSTWGSAT